MKDLTKTNPRNRWDKETALEFGRAVALAISLLDQVPRSHRSSPVRLIRSDLSYLKLDLDWYFASKGWV